MEKNGFTLIELIIVTALIGILTGVIALIFAVGLKTWSSGMGRANLRQDGNLAIEIMVRELSQAKSFTTAQSSQVKFDADIDDDGIDEQITFAISGANLTRTVDGTAAVLISNLQAFDLLYRDLNDVSMAFPITGGDRDNIRIIIMSLILNKGDETFTLSSSVYARNQGL